MNLEQPHWENETAYEYLMELGGSKSGAYQFLQDAHPELQKHLPGHTKYLAPGDDVEKFVRNIDDTRAKVVRGCHPLDVFGMVDVIPTKAHVRGREQIRQAILDVLESARREDVQSYMEYESGQPFDGQIGVLVQDDCGEERGSVVEHPHEKGLYRVAEDMPSITRHRFVDEEICDESGRAINRHLSDGMKAYSKAPRIDSQKVQRVIQLYQKVRDSGLMPQTHSFQMEYGVDEATREIRFYQSRLFRPFEPMADFRLQDLDVYGSSRTATTLAYHVFGTTPSTGTAVMHRAELTREFVERLERKHHVAYAYNNFQAREVTPLGVQPRNMSAYLSYQHSVLEHGHFRWIQKAPLVFVGLGMRNQNVEIVSGFGKVQKLQETMRVQFFSDGLYGLLKFVE